MAPTVPLLPKKLINTYNKHISVVIAQSFWNFFEGGLGLRDNLGGGPLFLCFIAFLRLKFSTSWVDPPLSPTPLCVHLRYVLLFGLCCIKIILLLKGFEIHRMIVASNSEKLCVPPNKNSTPFVSPQKRNSTLIVFIRTPCSVLAYPQGYAYPRLRIAALRGLT